MFQEEFRLIALPLERDDFRLERILRF
jgi:hypothetical protein